MNYKVKTIPYFDKQLKRLVKKFPSLKQEFKTLVNSLEIKPVQGTPIVNGCYKIRLAIASKRKGKRGGARVITYLQVVEQNVYLLSIYDKSDADTISDRQIADLLKMIE